MHTPILVLVQHLLQQIIHTGQKHSWIFHKTGSDHGIGEQLPGQQFGQFRIRCGQLMQLLDDWMPET